MKKKAAYTITQGIESATSLIRSRVNPYYVLCVLVADGMTDAQAKTILSWAKRNVELEGGQVPEAINEPQSPDGEST